MNKYIQPRPWDRSPDREDVHHILRCVQSHSEVATLLQVNAAIQAGGAPQLGEPVHCSQAQSAVHPHASRQAHVGAGFDVSTQGEVTHIPVVDVALQAQREQGGHVDGQFEGQTGQRRQRQLVRRQHGPLAQLDLVALGGGEEEGHVRR